MAYGYYRAITIDHTKVPGNLTDHPFLFNTTHLDLRTVGNGGHVTSALGYDIVFSPNSDGSSRYDHEIEKYDPATGEFIAHVKIPSISSSSNTVFYIVYGDSGVTTSQENITGVWDSNFKLVQHLNESSNPYLDSTSNNNDSTAGTYPTLSASGKIDGAQDFEHSSSEYISIPDAAALDFTTGFTSETWVKLETLPSVMGTLLFIYSKRQNEDPIINYELLCHHQTDPVDAFHFQAYVGGAWKTATWGTSSVIDTWYYVVAVYDGTNVKISVDNAAFVVGDATANLTANTGVMTIGISSTRASAWYWDGLIDELRFSGIARSADYRTATYNNQSSPGTFYDLQAAEQVSRSPRSGVTFASMIGVV